MQGVGGQKENRVGPGRGTIIRNLGILCSWDVVDMASIRTLLFPPPLLFTALPSYPN